MTRLVVPDDVGVEVVDGIVYVAHLPDGPIAVLDGIAAFIWGEALAGEREDLPSRVSTATSRPVQEIAEAVSEFIDDLLRRGLMLARSSDAVAAG